MNPTYSKWERLVALARQAPLPEDETAPYGFATRVVALAIDGKRLMSNPIERLAWRALGVSCLLAALGVVSSYSLFSHMGTSPSVDAFFTADDPASIVLDAAP